MLPTRVVAHLDLGRTGPGRWLHGRPAWVRRFACHRRPLRPRQAVPARRLAVDCSEQAWPPLAAVLLSRPSTGQLSLDTAACRRGSRRFDAVRARWSMASAPAVGRSPGRRTVELVTGRLLHARRMISTAPTGALRSLVASRQLRGTSAFLTAEKPHRLVPH